MKTPVLYQFANPPSVRTYSFDLCHLPPEDRLRAAQEINRIFTTQAEVQRFEQDMKNHHCAVICKKEGE